MNWKQIIFAYVLTGAFLTFISFSIMKAKERELWERHSRVPREPWIVEAIGCIAVCLFWPYFVLCWISYLVGWIYIKLSKL